MRKNKQVLLKVCYRSNNSKEHIQEQEKYKKQKEMEYTNTNVDHAFCKDIVSGLVDKVLGEKSINPKNYSRIKENEKNMEILTKLLIKNMRKIKAGENYLQNYCGEGN